MWFIIVVFVIIVLISATKSIIRQCKIENAKHEIKMQLAAAEAERKQKEAERIAYINLKEIERQQKENEKRRKELEKERQQLATVERKQAEAQTIIEHYEPIRKELIERIKQLETEYYAAECSGKSGAALEKAKKPLDSAKEKLFQTEHKLEKAYFIINQ